MADPENDLGRRPAVFAIAVPAPPFMAALGAAMLWAILAAPLQQHLFPARIAVAAVPRVVEPAPSTEELRRELEREAILGLIHDYRRQGDESSRRQLAETIHRESRAAAVDPLLVAAIVARESSFRTRAVSHRGAVGLMQLRPWVARDVADGAGVEWDGVETLHRPDRNVRLGALYYRELLERFDGDHERALTAYNRGPTRVGRQIANGTYRGSAYARQILELYDSIKEKSAV